MIVHQLNAWDVLPAEAVEIQRRLAPLVIRRDEVGDVRRVAGVDVGFVGERTRAAVVVLAYPELRVLDVSLALEPTRFPYVPGLLSFREAPAVLSAFEALKVEPDLVIVDGQGIAHPRRLGIAAHLGLCLDRPTIGCAKSLLVGRHGPLGEEVGATAELVDRGEVVGAAVRTKRGVKPVYVSIGNRVDLPVAIRYVLACCRGYRLPEPQRQAHLAASANAGAP
jgi:deoxyribonuclease V